MFFKCFAFFVGFFCIVLLNLSSVSAKEDTGNRKKIVVTFSILEDIVSVIGGKKVHVTSLVKRNMDAHMFRPTPSDARRISSADLVVMNGIGFEGWIKRLVKASGYKGVILIAAKNIKKLRQKKHHGHNINHAGGWDPHVWFSVPNMKIYVANIAEGISRIDLPSKKYYMKNLKKYTLDLDNLDKFIRSSINSIPKKNRKVITSHDAFGYLAREYGIKMLSPQGISTESEASASKVATLIRQIKKTSVKAIFFENIADNRLVNQIARQTSVQIGGNLYSDALSEKNGMAGNYIDYMRYNVRTILKALK